MEFVFDDRDVVKLAEFDEVSEFYKLPTKVFLQNNANNSTEPKSEKRGFFSKKIEDKKELDYSTITDENINKELDQISSEDLTEFTGLLISLIDWGIEKILNNFFNREQVIERPSDKKMKERLKIVGAKIVQKWGVTFKIEFLFLMMFFGYVASRYTGAKIIDETKESKKKKNTFFSKNIESVKSEIVPEKKEKIEPLKAENIKIVKNENKRTFE